MRMRPSLCCLTLAFFGFLSLANAAFHPADTDSNSSLTIDEVTAYAAAWKSGATWSSGPSPISDAYYQQAIYIWKNGETYRDANSVAAPRNWVPSPTGGTQYLPTALASAQPFDLLPVNDIDSSLALEVSFVIEGQPGVFTALWSPASEDNSINIVTPLNPFTATGEGTVSFTIKDTANAQRWVITPIELDSLAPAPGLTLDLLSQASGVLAAKVTSRGYDLANYDSSSPLGAPQSIRPLLYIDALLNNTENPNSLANQIQLLSAEELDLTDRIFNKLGLGNAFANSLNASILPAQSRDIIRLFAGECTGDAFLEINNAATLATAMADQASAKDEDTSTDSKQDTAGKLINIKGNFDIVKSYYTKKFTKIEPPSPNALPKEAQFGVLQAVSLTLTVKAFFDFYDASNLPSHFTDLELTIDGPERGYFLEDGTDCETAAITLKATVASDGYDHSKMMEKIMPGGPFELPGKKELYTWANNKFGDTKDLDLPPYVWCDLNLSSDDYGTVTGDDFIGVTGYNFEKVAMDFKPLKVGGGTLTAVVKAGAFSGKSYTSTKNYSTAPIIVQFVNPTLIVNGDEPSITYLAKFIDADQVGSNNIQWTVSAGAITSKRTLGNGFYEIDWTPPFDKGSYPVAITAKYTSIQCLRGLPGAQERKQTITVNTDDWEIIPTATCLDKGQTIQFDISGNEADPIEVTWSVTSGPGTIDPDSGLFTAGQTEGAVIVRATPAQGDFKETSLTIGCALIVAWELDPNDAPASPTTVHPTISAFLLQGETPQETDAITSDVFITYETITPPAEGQQVGTVAGSFLGAGLYYSHDVAVNAALVDDSNALKSYMGTGTFGEPYEYYVEAGFSAVDFDDTGRDVNLLGGPDGTDMEMRLDAGVSGSGAVDNNTVTYNWIFSNGTQAAGQIVTPTFDRSATTFTARLYVTDAHGNTAEYSQSFLIVEVFGSFQFRYAPNKGQVSCITSQFTLPPMEIDGAIVEFTTDPELCKLSLYVDGGRSATVSTSSSTTGIAPDSDPPIYVIGFGGTQ